MLVYNQNNVTFQNNVIGDLGDNCSRIKGKGGRISVAKGLSLLGHHKKIL